MHEGKGDIFVWREELPYVGGFNIAALPFVICHIRTAI